MKKSMIINGILCGALLGSVSLASAAATNADSIAAAQFYTASVKDVNTHINKGKLSVAFTLDLGEKNVRSQHKRVLTPVIRTADGRASQALPPVVVNGRNRAIMDRKQGIEASTAAGAFCVLRGNKDENRYVKYSATTDFAQWMQKAQIEIDETVTGCARCGVAEVEHPVTGAAVYEPEFRFTPYAACPREFVPRSEKRDAFLIYPVNKTQLFPERYGNARELAKIDSALAFVRSNPDYAISRISIAGYASPEGGYAHNVELAEGRAEALKRYVDRRYPALPDTLLAVTAGSENWGGLMEALKSYEIPYKDEIISVIENVNDPDGREDAIKRIGGGVPYQTILHSIYPGLRKNTFTISYVSRERSTEKARELVFTHPEELNPYEFYRVADSCYAGDSEMRSKIMKIAADTYPQHSIVNLNAARLCMEQGDYEAAERYLMNTDQGATTWNTRACLLWQQGKADEAVLWWQKAARAGDADAEHNLAEAEQRGY